MNKQNIELNSSDDHALSLTVYTPRESIKGVLVLGHAMMTNSRSMDKPKGKGLASYLAEQGYLCYALDARGRGGSGAKAIDGNDWSYDDLVLKDLPAVIGVVKSRHPDNKLFVLGHSLFGHGCLGMLGAKPETPVDGVVCIAGNIWLPQLEKHYLKKLQKSIQLQIMDKLTRIFKRMPAKKIKFGNEDEAYTYSLGFLRWWKNNTWSTLDGEWDYLEGLSNVAQPVLAISGSGDNLMCTPECSRRFMAYLGKSELTHYEAGKRASGLDYDPGHMDLVTNIKSKPVWGYIVTWLDSLL